TPTRTAAAARRRATGLRPRRRPDRSLLVAALRRGCERPRPAGSTERRGVRGDRRARARLRHADSRRWIRHPVWPGQPPPPPRVGRTSMTFPSAAGRLRSGVSTGQAAAELGGLARRLQARFPVENARKRGVQMIRVIDGVVGPFRTALLTIFAAVGAVLLIA